MPPLNQDKGELKESIPELTPPGNNHPSGTNPDRSGWWLGIGLIILVLLGITVVMVLPDLVATPPAPTAEPVPQAEFGTPEIDHRKRGEAEASLARVLRQRALLENRNVAIWGGDDYTKLLEQLSKADTALGSGRFDQAARSYQQVSEGLERLQQSTDQRYTAALAGGQSDLEAGAAKMAETRFRIALALRPNDPQATRGLIRSENLPRVQQLSSQGAALETQQRWEAAGRAYADASALDPEYPPALVGLDRVAAKLKEQAFRTAMNELFASLESGAYPQAEQALARARGIDPQARELPEAAAQLTRARTNAQLHRLRTRADRAMANEQWKSAARLFREALKLDPLAAFAGNGLREAELRQALHKRMRHYLDQPERLQTPQVLANAKAILKSAEAITEPGPKWRREQEALQAIIDAAQQPLPVHLYSDGLTQVVVYRVGRLGHFNHRQLSLRPGSYTVVGSRDGYRDVRRVFKVRSGEPGLEITIRCEEPI